MLAAHAAGDGPLAELQARYGPGIVSVGDDHPEGKRSIKRVLFRVTKRSAAKAARCITRC
jgi:hypothetical protein